MLVIQSKCEERADDKAVPQALLEGFLGIRSLAFSARTGHGRESLLGTLRDAVSELDERHPTTALGKGWVRVRDELRRRLNEDHVRALTKAEFTNLCKGVGGVSDPSVLLEYLHRAGVVFHREHLFRGEIILDQNWALEAIYSIFDRKRCLPRLLAIGTGTFTRSDLDMLAWGPAGYSKEEQKLFLSMMESCGICFRWRDTPDGETVWLAPDLLPAHDAEPVRERLQGRLRASDLPRRTIRFIYPFLHDGIVRELLSKVGREAKDAAVYWRTGLYLYESRSEAYALVNAAPKPTKAEPGAGEIELSVYGDRSDDLAALLHDTIRKLDPPPCEIVDSGNKPMIRYNRVGHPAMDNPPLTPDQVNELQAARFTLPAPAPRGAKPSVFISYAWGDDTAAGKQRTTAVESLLKKLEVEGYDVQVDYRKIRMGESIQAFLRQFGTADRVIPIISDKYLDSQYCMFELLSVWQSCSGDTDRFQKRVYPVIMDDAQIGTPLLRGKRAVFWKQRHKELSELQKELGDDFGEADYRELRLMSQFKAQISDMLYWLNDVLMPRGFDEIQADDYKTIIEILGRTS